MPRPATWWGAVMAAPIAAGLLVCAPSCGSFSATNDNAVGDAMTDAPVTEDVASKDAAEDATDGAVTDGGQNLFPRGDFERACSGNGYHSSLILDPTGHGAGRSCLVCNNELSTDVFSFDNDIANVMPAVGDHYVAEAWIRTSPMVGPPDSGVELTLRTHTDPFVQHDDVFTTYVKVMDTWQLLTIELDITEAGIPKLEIIVDGQHDLGKCFLVDDMVVRRVQ